ncbi:retrovirus-related pol polyprotein from transposon TNT 1-94 [Tanacetum coccineum]
MGMVDNILFTKKKSSNLIIVQIYVDDIIFSSTCQDMFDEFAKIMHDEFKMSMMGELVGIKSLLEVTAVKITTAERIKTAQRKDKDCLWDMVTDTHKRTKIKPKRTKPSTEWKSV